MLVGIQAQANVAGEELVLLLSKLRVHLAGRGPGGGAVFLALPCPALIGGAVEQSQDIRSRTGQNGQAAVLCPMNVKRVFQRCCQFSHDVRQAAAQGLGNQQRGPDHRNVQKQADGETACFRS